MQLKTYQVKTLEVLKKYLEAARIKGAHEAFAQQPSGSLRYLSYYQSLEGLSKIPYVCLRLPTGGGKTLLASHSIRIVADSYLEQEYPLVLWLVPTNTIREQTLIRLKDPKHPYREILDAAFERKVKVIDIADFEQLRPQDILNHTCVVMGTLATLRVDNTEGRKVYAHNENLEPHFAKIPANAPKLERLNESTIKYSFCNILYLANPLVIIDEAHNASTPLSFEVLGRINPACVIEFTATPAANSNVLHSVSAAELKAEEMIKLPIILTEHKTWQAAISHSIATRSKLEESAKKDGQYIRPIVLIQAEDKDEEITYEVVEKYLTDEEKIDRSRIAIATGSKRELEGINLLDPKCPIEFVITVQALKEGWDCSFAYVFCSVASVHSAKDVEQILGRVLRMPYAKRRKIEELNQAYANVSSSSWPKAVSQLHDRLVSMGFDEQEAQQAIKQEMGELFSGTETLSQKDVLKISLSNPPDLKALDPEEKSRITVEKDKKEIILSIKGEISNELEEKILKAVSSKEKPEVKKVINNYRQHYVKSPAEQGKKFVVPRLCVEVQGELELAERDLLLELSAWNLLKYSWELSEQEFLGNEEAVSYLVDIKENRLFERYLGADYALDLTGLKTEWTELQLSRWLDRQLSQPDIKREVLLEYLRKAISFLVEKRKIPLSTLVRLRYILEKALREKIKANREEALRRGFQETLFGSKAKVETSSKFEISFDPHIYPASWFYNGSYQFNKHFYSSVGELKSEGEEFDCAKALDQMPEVEYWVRNLERQPTFSFWLPTSTDNFYPDFVAKLKNGKILVVEYKGEHLATADDAKEKQNVGELWEEKSDEKGIFMMISSLKDMKTRI